MRELISWFDIPTRNFERAVEFYQNVFNLTLNIVEGENEKMGCFPDEDVNVSGCIFYSPNYKPAMEGISISFCCEDIEELLQRVELNGGNRITPKTKILVEGRGYFAVFSDSEGNRIGIYSDK